MISNNTIADNSAGTGNGGGVNISGAGRPSVVLRDNLIIRNSADHGGGVATDAYTTITGNLIAWNAASSYGSLFYVYPWSWHHASDIPVTCNTIVENTGPAGVGNGVYTTVLSPFHQNTIYGNSGYQFASGTGSDLDATQNYWSTTDAGQIAAGIYDHSDDPGLGVVSFSPFLSTPDTCAPPPTGVAFSISGHVRDDSDNPIPSVTVSAGAGGSATTDASGDYTITGLITGTYTLTPSKSGWTFTPDTRTVSVPPSATGQDFMGTPRFLDLPFDYSGIPFKSI